MVRNQGPGVTLRLGFFEDVGEPFQDRGKTDQEKATPWGCGDCFKSFVMPPSFSADGLFLGDE